MDNLPAMLYELLHSNLLLSRIGMSLCMAQLH